jgi:hypothetical protein
VNAICRQSSCLAVLESQHADAVGFVGGEQIELSNEPEAASGREGDVLQV